MLMVGAVIASLPKDWERLFAPPMEATPPERRELEPGWDVLTSLGRGNFVLIELVATARPRVLLRNDLLAIYDLSPYLLKHTHGLKGLGYFFPVRMAAQFCVELSQLHPSLKRGGQVRV